MDAENCLVDSTNCPVESEASEEVNYQLMVTRCKGILNLKPSDYGSTEMSFLEIDVHRAVHHNIIYIVKPTRRTNVSNLFYFGMTLYMFRTVFPSIIRSSRLYKQQLAYVKQILLSAC